MTFDRQQNSYAQGVKGSRFALRNDRTISIQSGQFLLGARYSPVSFRTMGTNLRLPAGGLALVTIKGNNQTSITLLDKGRSEGVFVEIAGGSAVKLIQADELTVASYSSTDNRSKAGRSAAAGLRYKTSKTKADIQVLLANNMLLNCHTIRLQNAWPYKRLDTIYGVGLARKAPVKPSAAKSATGLLPIAYVSVTPADCWMSPHGVVTKIAEGHFYLRSGSILARGKQPITVDTPQGSVTVKEDAVAIISIQNKMTRVMNLIDHHRKGVVATSMNRVLELSPGREAVLVVATAEQIKRVVLDDAIGHKDIQTVQIDPEHGLITGQFAMGDLLAQHPLLQRLRKSEDKADQDLVKSLMKTAAAQATMGGQ